MESNFSSTTPANGSDKTTAKPAYNEAKSAAQDSAATLRSQLSSLKSDLDALVNRAPSLSDDELAQAHARLMAQFSSLRYAAKGIASAATDQFNRGVETTTTYVKRGAEKTSVYVKDKPMQSVAVAAATGVILGMLFKRR